MLIEQISFGSILIFLSVYLDKWMIGQTDRQIGYISLRTWVSLWDIETTSMTTTTLKLTTITLIIFHSDSLFIAICRLIRDGILHQ